MCGLEGEASATAASLYEGAQEEKEEREEGDNGSLGLGKFLFSSFARSAGLNVPFFLGAKKTTRNPTDSTAKPVYTHPLFVQTTCRPSLEYTDEL